MPTMDYRAMNGVVLCVHKDAPPTDAEWDGFVELCAKHLNGRGIVWTNKGGPSPKQRTQLNERIKGGPLRTAVCSGATIVRGVVTAFSWFNPLIKAFAKTEFDAAIEHVGIPAALGPPLLAQLMKMEASLDN